jgi:hypothetical protein
MVSLSEQKKSQMDWDIVFLLEVTRMLLGYKVATDRLYALHPDTRPKRA